MIRTRVRRLEDQVSKLGSEVAGLKADLARERLRAAALADQLRKETADG